MSLVDARGRRINYLRLSVTDRCNLRCQYCMPAEGVPGVGHENVLRYEELLEVARAALCLGVEKVRITGGEPLVRRGIIGFLERLSALPGLQRLVLTTNGSLLPSLAEPVRDAGVQSLNVSLDSLFPDTYREITRGGELQDVLRGIDTARSLGLAVKINMVVMRGVNDQEVLGFARWADAEAHTVRFIEQMPVLKVRSWGEGVVSGKEILDRIAGHYELIPVERSVLGGPAAEYRLGSGAGQVGVITPLSGHFCASCNRIRVTSAGMARACLFSDQETDLKPYLRAGDGLGLLRCLRTVIVGKPAQHGITPEGATGQSFSMATIGG